MLIEHSLPVPSVPAGLDVVMGTCGPRDVVKVLSVFVQCVDVGGRRIDQGRVPTFLVTAEGGFAPARNGPTPVGVTVNRRIIVGAVETIFDFVVAISGGIEITSTPASCAVIIIITSTLLGIACFILRIPNVAVVLVTPDQFTARVRICSNPSAVVLPVPRGIAGEIQRVALTDHTQNVFLGALGHLDILIPPPGHINVIHRLTIIRPIRGPGGGTGGAVEGFVQLGITVAELVDRHITGIIQHRLALGIGELGEPLVINILVIACYRLCRADGQGFVAGIGPVDIGVRIINPLNEHFTEPIGTGSIGIVIADLSQGDIHGSILATNFDFFGADLLGNAGRGP